MILYIPLPLLWKVRLPLRQYVFPSDFTFPFFFLKRYLINPRRKFLYGAWLCTGVFIVLATLLRCIICLGDPASINLGTIWSIRETVREIC